MRKVALHPNMVYHIYNRGVDRGDVFFTRANWLFFLRRLRAYCGRDRGEILA